MRIAALLTRFFAWRWPLPALLVWVFAWVVFVAVRLLQVPMTPALLLAATVGLVAGAWAPTRVRRVVLALGFPLSWWLLVGSSGGSVWSGLPAWGWLVPLAVALVLYPPRTWRDAPLYPTPSHALVDLPTVAPLPPGARVLDAGCGLGHGLDALAEAYPLSRWVGLESSVLLRWLCAWRCPWATVLRGDMWNDDWSAYDLVYLFQRPETMPRSWAKAQAELKPGAWLVSLAFEVPGVEPTACLPGAAGKPVWVYRV
jgi:hypothetical protein